MEYGGTGVVPLSYCAPTDVRRVVHGVVNGSPLAAVQWREARWRSVGAGLASALTSGVCAGFASRGITDGVAPAASRVSRLPHWLDRPGPRATGGCGFASSASGCRRVFRGVAWLRRRGDGPVIGA